MNVIPELSEEDTKYRYITPAIEKSGWSKLDIRLEYFFTDGKVIVQGNNVTRGKSKKADYFPAELRGSETSDLFIVLMMYRLKRDGRAAVIVLDGFLFGTDGAKFAIKRKLITEFNLHTIIRLPQSVFAPYTSISTNILFFDANQNTEKIWFYRVDIPDGYKHFSKSKPMKLGHFADCQA